MISACKIFRLQEPPNSYVTFFNHMINWYKKEVRTQAESGDRKQDIGYLLAEMCIRIEELNAGFIDLDS